jgi:hypothetical protein
MEIILYLRIEGHEEVICTIYGPSNDTPPSFANIQNHIDDMQCSSIIWCGDFNLVLNPDMDYYNYKHINNPKTRDKILEIMENNYYIDPFRQLHVHENIRSYMYSWRKKNSTETKSVRFLFDISNSLVWFRHM